MTDAVSLGKGAWDCTNNVEIPPEKEVRSQHGATHPPHLDSPHREMPPSALVAVPARHTNGAPPICPRIYAAMHSQDGRSGADIQSPGRTLSCIRDASGRGAR
jgi:hypothetical protein